jgi:hypothetical protein
MGSVLFSPFLSVAILGRNGNTSKTVWEKLSDADESHNTRIVDSPIYNESELSGDEKRPQMKMSIQPAWEPEEIADEIDRMIEEGGKHCSEQLSLKDRGPRGRDPSLNRPPV